MRSAAGPAMHQPGRGSWLCASARQLRRLSCRPQLRALPAWPRFRLARTRRHRPPRAAPGGSKRGRTTSISPTTASMCGPSTATPRSSAAPRSRTHGRQARSRCPEHAGRQMIHLRPTGCSSSSVEIRGCRRRLDREGRALCTTGHERPADRDLRDDAGGRTQAAATADTGTDDGRSLLTPYQHALGGNAEGGGEAQASIPANSAAAITVSGFFRR